MRRFYRTSRSLDRYDLVRDLRPEAALFTAIRRRVRVKFSYGQERHLRIFEPFAIFRDMDNLLQVYGWQVRNPGQTNEPATLRRFEIARLGALALTDATITASAIFFRTPIRGAREIICSI